MKYIELYTALENMEMHIFSINDIIQLFKSDRAVTKQQILYWKKRKWIKTLKKGLYEVAYPKREPLSDLFIANKLYEPSYVSLETALSYYSIIPDVAMGVTSVTTKPTREFRNQYGFFRYRSIVKRAYCGYGLINDHGQMIKIAEPEKAFVDSIYFKMRDKELMDIDVLRLNKRKLKELDMEKISRYASDFNKRLKDRIDEMLC